MSEEEINNLEAETLEAPDDNDVQALVQTSSSVTYPYGYGGKRKTKEQYLLWSSYQRVDPELARRIMAMMELAQSLGKNLGMGGTWRSSEGQEKLFRSRYFPDPKGRTYWKAPNGDGPHWTKRAGVAAAATPGKSYHEASTSSGKCLAVDMIGDMVWMDANCAKFHMYNFNSELWHVQPVEIPAGRTPYKIYDSPPKKPLPQSAEEVKPGIVVPRPSLREGSKGNEVTLLQNSINFWKWDQLSTDGWFGPKTTAGVKKMQEALKQLADGLYGPKTSQAYYDFLVEMQTYDPAK